MQYQNIVQIVYELAHRLQSSHCEFHQTGTLLVLLLHVVGLFKCNLEIHTASKNFGEHSGRRANK